MSFEDGKTFYTSRGKTKSGGASVRHLPLKPSSAPSLQPMVCSDISLLRGCSRI